MTEICRRSQRRKQNYIVILRLRDFFDGLEQAFEIACSYFLSGGSTGTERDFRRIILTAVPSKPLTKRRIRL